MFRWFRWFRPGVSIVSAVPVVSFRWFRFGVSGFSTFHPTTERLAFWRSRYNVSAKVEISPPPFFFCQALVLKPHLDFFSLPQEIIYCLWLSKRNVFYLLSQFENSTCTQEMAATVNKKAYSGTLTRHEIVRANAS